VSFKYVYVTLHVFSLRQLALYLSAIHGEYREVQWKKLVRGFEGLHADMGSHVTILTLFCLFMLIRSHPNLGRSMNVVG